MSETNSIANKKRVSFAGHAMARLTISRDEFSVAELEATWFTREEYSSIQESCCKQILKMDAREVLLDKKFCSRGLEVHTRNGSMSRIANRKDASRAILEEQDAQWAEEGHSSDPESIALAYRRISSSCHLWARAIGLKDQREAENYADEEVVVTTVPASSAALASKAQLPLPIELKKLESGSRSRIVQPARIKAPGHMRHNPAPQFVPARSAY